MSFLSFKMTELDQNIFDTVILEHPVDNSELGLAQPNLGPFPGSSKGLPASDITARPAGSWV